MTNRITPDLLLRAYAMGVFPMAEARDSTDIQWVEPRRRGIFPLNGFHISRSLAKSLRARDYQITIDRDFSGVVQACTERPETWINDEIFRLYNALFDMGHAHSLEVWDKDQLIGGVYGVVLGGAFFGESMFSRRPNASKIALAWLVHRLRAGGFQLFDTQFLTPHLASLGAVEITRAQYQSQLAAALPLSASFAPAGYQPLSSDVASSGASPSGAASSSGTSSTSGKASSGTSQRSTQTS